MKYAVIIGINNYDDNNIQPLQFAANDAEEFHELLITNADYPKENCFLFTENTLFPTYTEIKSRTEDICKKAIADDHILIYFAGHGQEINGKSYLIFKDTILDEIPNNILMLEELNKMLHTSKAKFKIRFFDACHSGQKGIRGKENVMSENFYRALTPRLEGFITIASCKQNQYSYEWPEKRHGVFTYFLLEALNGAADSDKDNKVTLHEAYEYVFQGVSSWCTESNVQIRQEPLFSAEYSGLFEFAYLKDKPYESDKPDNDLAIEIFQSFSLPSYHLSSVAEQIALLLCRQSKTGLPHDTILSIDVIEKQTNISLIIVEEAVDELKDKGLVNITHVINAPTRIQPNNALFWATDSIVNGWDTAKDAQTVASILVKKNEQALRPSELNEILGWDYRRINPATTFLADQGFVEASKASGSHPYAYPWIRANIKTRRFLKSSNLTVETLTREREKIFECLSGDLYIQRRKGYELIDKLLSNGHQINDTLGKLLFDIFKREDNDDERNRIVNILWRAKYYSIKNDLLAYWLAHAKIIPQNVQGQISNYFSSDVECLEPLLDTLENKSDNDFPDNVTSYIFMAIRAQINNAYSELQEKHFNRITQLIESKWHQKNLKVPIIGEIYIKITGRNLSTGFMG